MQDYIFTGIKGVEVVITAVTSVHGSVEKVIHERNTLFCKGAAQARNEVFLKAQIKEVSHEKLLELHKKYVDDKIFFKRWYNIIFSNSSIETENLIKLATERDASGAGYFWSEKTLASEVVNFMLKSQDKGFCVYLFSHVNELVSENSPSTITNVRVEQSPANENVNENASPPVP